MIVVASANGAVGIPAAMAVLATGGSAVDAVEAAVRLVEDNPEDHTVGYSGYPNVLGEVELDASIMEGTTRRAGAVGALHGYRHAITVARHVMEALPHVLVVGDGAARLAEHMGMTREDLLTEEARRIWREGLEGTLDPTTPMAEWLHRIGRLATDPEHVAGTVNVIAQDGQGRLAVAVSTSGAAWKYPGRLGDSPVIGAGNYADDRYGAAACTGWGELAIRAGTARQVVEGLRRGLSVEEACVEALRELRLLGGVTPSEVLMHVVAVDPEGRHCAATTRNGWQYALWTDSMEAPRTANRLHVGLV
ncbi:MAG TPA: N(4)-(beta-N-acetylglucosaminyl)-L-asparaginase [Verrucomicrobiae bacterium]|nr:N(4)-(beta-N-acetylglucosaminyl)-L-asparaginase [Verrucomicrobiae bacterium]